MNVARDLAGFRARPIPARCRTRQPLIPIAFIIFVVWALVEGSRLLDEWKQERPRRRVQSRPVLGPLSPWVPVPEVSART